MMKKDVNMTLPYGYYRSERYSDVLWITDGRNHEVWIAVGDSRWLMTSIIVDNWPSVGVSVIDEISHEQLAANLHYNCHGWSARGGALEDCLRIDNDRNILSIADIKTVDSAYAAKMTYLYSLFRDGKKNAKPKK